MGKPAREDLSIRDIYSKMMQKGRQCLELVTDSDPYSAQEERAAEDVPRGLLD
jgi:hypothetical protein